ncbi:MAG TPA: vanadium-dependent haloperoxidase, partial [Candidatus Dormibacteraeota bacterium]|nr:vanadium-dependent haloperoxidase [Candidatus Dormibacteraeota bacterium]
NAWQPLTYVDSSGALVTPRFVGAQWNRVVPFGLKAASQLRSHNGPARVGTRQFLEQAEALIEISSQLTDEEKVIAEYWADGPHSELPPGHWDLFAQFVSRRDHRLGAERGLEREVKLFFLLTNAISDAAICAWDNKRAFNSVRPITAVRYLFYGRRFRAWGGPYLGTRLIRGEEWLPYQPSTFPTPPFPEYTSGHSTFSAAGAEILRLFTGDERFGASVVIPAGSSKVEPGATPAMDVMLKWPTFTDTADQAGISRRFGGIHFEQGDLDGRETGRQVARLCWNRAQALFEGDD